MTTPCIQSHARRTLLKKVAFTLGMASLSPHILAAVLTNKKYTVTQNTLLNQAQLQFIGLIADLILPQTSTPSASQAGVPEFISTMLNHGFSVEHQQQFLVGLVAFQLALQTNKVLFTELPNDQQLQQLTAIDHQSFVDYTQSPAHLCYRELKQLILLGYFSSELGATQAQRYQAVPGPFRGCIPYKKGDKAWATDMT